MAAYIVFFSPEGYMAACIGIFPPPLYLGLARGFSKGNLLILLQLTLVEQTRRVLSALLFWDDIPAVNIEILI